MKKFFLMIFITATFSCNNGSEISANFSSLGFYSSPEEIISELSGRNGYHEHFMLGIAFKKKKMYEKSVVHFANSAFNTKRNASIKHFPSPVLKFTDSFFGKSPYYDDAMYELADIYYYYREHSAVIKLVDRIPKSKSALYLEANLLKSKSLSDQKKYTEALDLLGKLADDFTDTKSAPVIRIRTASIHEKLGNDTSAIKDYLTVLQKNEDGWETEVAVKRISYIIAKGKISLTDKNYFTFISGLYSAGKYDEGYSIARKLYDAGSLLSGLYPVFIRLCARNSDDKIPLELINSTDPAEKSVPLKKLYADELYSMKKYTRAMQLLNEVSSSGIEPQSKDSLKKIALFIEERRIAGYENKLMQFKNKYPSDTESEYFIWLLGRKKLKENSIDEAVRYFEEGLKKFPEGNYSDRYRFWLQKIYSSRGKSEAAERLMKEMIAINPDSSFTWIIMRNLSGKVELKKLYANFDRAVSSNNKINALAYHALIYASDKDLPKRNDRIKKISFGKLAQYEDYNRAVSSLTLSSRFKEQLKNLEKYFAIGYDSAISREVKMLPDEEAVSEDKTRALSYFSGKYSHFYYGVYYGLDMLKKLGIKENISLLSEEALRLLFPQSHYRCVTEYSAQYKIPKAMIYSLIKAESLFNHDAVSPVGAAGLMQLMPDTAKGIARDLSIKKYDLNDPCTSVLFGTKYLSWLNRYYKGVFQYMVAAYNAGPGNVNTWKERAELKDMDYFAEFVPFIETRYYVVRTDKFLTQYNIIYPKQ